MLPSVVINKTAANTGVVRPSPLGICAIIAPSQQGTANIVASYADSILALNDYGYGPLVDFAAYVMAETGNNVLLIRPTTSTAAAYGTPTITGAGTSIITMDGVQLPYDDFDALITFIAGGTVGVAGITYTYSLDGGKTTSGVQSLGTANTITIPNSGVKFDLGVGTILAGETAECLTTGPRMTNTDLSTALEALRTSNLPWECVLVHGESTATTVSTLDTWLAGLEGVGQYRFFIVNSRGKNAGESEAAFATAMQTAWNSSASIRGVVCTELGDLVSAIPGRGITQARPVALGLAARLMGEDVSRDAAYVADGPIPAFSIADARGNPKHHDERFYPGLDDLRLCTLRSFDGLNGVYITNANLISPPGSDFIWAQHARVMNLACSIAYQILTQQLSLGVKTRTDPNNPNRALITEDEASRLEGLVQMQFNAQLVRPTRVTGAACILSRNDDLSSNGPGTLSASLQINALRYVKKFVVNAMFVRTITVSTGG